MSEDQVEVETFSEFLKSLTQSKDSINKVTKYAITNAHLAQQFLDAILKRMKKLPTKRKITLFYLIDSICQNANAKKVGEEWLDAVGNGINTLAQELLQEKEPEEKEPAIQALKKVFHIWKERKIIEPERVDSAISTIEGENKEGGNDDAVLDFFEFEEAQRRKNKKESEPPSKKSRRRYQDVYASPSEADEEKLRIMEDYRRESKRIRWEQRLRPENDAYFSEFDEWWNLIGEREIRKYIPDYDFKAPFLRNALQSSTFEDHYFKQTMHLLSPYMASGSSPSFSSPNSIPLTPSPSTPYSPTQNSKNRITPDSIVSLSPRRFIQRPSQPEYSMPPSNPEYYPNNPYQEEPQNRRDKVDKFERVDRWNRKGNGRNSIRGKNQFSSKYDRHSNRFQKDRRSPSNERKRSRSREPRDYRSRRERSRSRERHGRSRSSSRDRRRSRSRSSESRDSYSSVDSRDSRDFRDSRRRDSLPSRTISEIPKERFEEPPNTSEKPAPKKSNRYEPDAASDDEVYTSRPSKFLEKSPAKSKETASKKVKDVYSPTSPSSSPEREKKEKEKEKSGASHKKHHENTKVFIWNLDESLLVFNSNVKDSQKIRTKEALSSLSSKLSNLTQDILNSYMYYKQIQEFEPATMEEMAQYDDKRDLTDYNFQKDGLRSRNPNSDDKRKASYRFRKIRELYESRKFTSKHEAESLVRDMDKISKGWFSTGRSIIRELSERSDTVNIVYSSSQVVEILAKLILCRVSDFISPQHIYSTTILAKRELYQQIKDKYPNSRYIVFGDGLGDEEATKEENIVFRRISTQDDLQQIQSEIDSDIESMFSLKSHSSSGSGNKTRSVVS